MTDTIQFLLNDQLISLTQVNPNLTLLKYLREQQLKSGTKEGCASGDCGACTVVSVEIDAKKSDRLVYKSVNACISLIGQMHGKQVITVEHLKQGDRLHPVQQQMVDHHASQCGFCTPGFVMSSYALHQNNPQPNREEVVQALAGNLCRCTGYRSIIDAAMQPCEEIAGSSEREQSVIQQLAAIAQQSSLDFQSQQRRFFSPKTTDELADYLVENPQAKLVAGGTDLVLEVTQNLVEFEQLVYLGQLEALTTIYENDQQIVIGAAASYCDFEPLLKKHYPELGAMISRIGATQVRNTGTLGGNIANASPIGDMPPALIALGARVKLQQGDKIREIALQDYFIDYKKTQLKTAEFILSIQINKLKSNQRLKVYKLSKRFDDDISAVLAACFIELEDQTISKIRIAFGGMAAIPKRASHCEKFLLGKSLSQNNIDQAKRALAKDFSPMSDVRASADYRMLAAQNILQRFYLEILSVDQTEEDSCHLIRVSENA
ncbi:MAG: xanthine dehydrogenase small subunit [Enterobacterales bacterium]|nr:xanthine dehydrogenase small subunit [Enterobacterales bacterium]